MMYKAWQAFSLQALRENMRRVLQTWVCMFQSLLRLMTCHGNLHHVRCLMEAFKQPVNLLMIESPCWARQRRTCAAKARDLSSPLVGEMLYEGVMLWRDNVLKAHLHV